MTRTKMTVGDAQAFSLKRKLSAGSTSTLRKVARAFRIAEGLRGLPGAKPRKMAGPNGKTLIYHATQGWRWA